MRRVIYFLRLGRPLFLLGGFLLHGLGVAMALYQGARLDWILVSPEFRFERYAVYPDIVSDHYAVAAVIALAGE